MTRKDKLIKRLLSKPKDFTWNELTALLIKLGFEEVKTGKTSGSRRRFVNTDGMIIALHKPHLHNTLKQYQLEQIIETLKQERLL